MKRLLFFLPFLGLLLLGSCNQGSEYIDQEPDVAVSKIVSPLALTGQQSGGAGDGATPTDQGGVIDLLEPRSGPVLIPATQVFDPITGLTTENPLQVYVTASDELGVVSVELFYNGTSVGRRTLTEDGIQFKNPFIFPENGASLPLTGAPSGVTEAQLSAVAIDSSGQTIQSETVELLVDGSRPDINVTVVGSGTTGPITVFAEAVDSETGIASFEVTPAGSLTRESPTTLSGVFTQSGDLVFVATNGAGVTNTAATTFTVIETPPEPPVEPPIDPPGTNTPPTVTLTANPSFGDAPLSVIFTAAAQDADGDELTYAWDFGNGSTASSGTTQSATYPTAGTYTASVTVSDPNGGTATAETTVIVGGGGGGGGTGNENPTVSLTATPTTGPAPLAVNFTAAATDPDGDALTYAWTFGNGDTGGNSSTEATTYAVDGSYTATVTVTDGNGGTASDSEVITVGAGGGGTNQTPTVSLTATPTSGAAPLEVAFTATASDPDGDTLTYTWDFGNGDTTGSTSSESTTYTADGTYTATVTVSDGNGATAPASATITVGTGGGGSATAPTVTISGDDTPSAAPGAPLSLTASATDPNNETITYNWSASSSDASFSAANQPQTNVTFANAGTYTVTVTATDASGETDTDEVTVTVSSSGGGGGGNTNPVNAVDDSRGTARNQDVTISVLSNDEPSARALTIVAATSPRQGGRVAISRDSKTITYTPPRGFTGDDFFRYTARDGDGNGDTAGVTVRVR